jgi:hypothetical protein
MLGASCRICRWCVYRLGVGRHVGARSVMGLVPLVVLMAAEFGLTLMLGRSAAEFVAANGIVAGAIGLRSGRVCRFAPGSIGNNRVAARGLSDQLDDKTSENGRRLSPWRYPMQREDQPTKANIADLISSSSVRNLQTSSFAASNTFGSSPPYRSLMHFSLWPEMISHRSRLTGEWRRA